MKKIILSALLSVSLLISVAPVSFASSDNNQLSSEVINEITSNMNDLGIPDSVQSNLISKIESGEILDSNNPDMQNQGVTEVSDSGNIKVFETTFPDGSVTRSSIDESSAVITDIPYINPLASVEGGSATGGSGYRVYTGVSVISEDPFIKCRFKVDYYLIDKNSYISDVYDDFISALGGTYNRVYFGIDNKTESSSKPARATLSFDAAKTGYFMKTYKLFFYLQTYNPGPFVSAQFETY